MPFIHKEAKIKRMRETNKPPKGEANLISGQWMENTIAKKEKGKTK